ncbi:MAG: hypothetical protein LBL94_02895 [Prevotellaceae bacterium]|jgi:hypothetical protein|nr:hypothetical protein [Prevotellaceae bacterium]
MKLFFNELSCEPVADSKYSAIERMNIFAKTVSIARRKGFRNIRCDTPANAIMLTQQYSLFDWLNDSSVSREYRDFMYGVIVPPYIDEDDPEFEQYVYSTVTFENTEYNISKTVCIGLASAYLYNLPVISILSIPLWKQHILSITIEKDGSIFSENVYNISSCESFSISDIIDFIDSISEFTLVETSLKPEDKAIHLADHHGKAELQELCNQLKHNPYVEEMRSTDWGGNRFIRKTHRNSIEIVLCKTQRKYALLIKTTGRNKRETQEIAKILEEKFNK